MRWGLVGLGIILLGLGMLLSPVGSVFAATSEDVMVTASGFVVGAPTGFTVTRVSDHEVLIEWTKHEKADNTMVRGKYGDYPGSKDDGYQVYYGSGDSVSDTSVSLDDTGTGIYYRAWSEDESEMWSEDYAEGWTQGIGMTLIAIVVLTLGLLGFSIHYKNIALMFLAAAAGIALAVYGFANMSGSGQDAYWVLGIIGAVLTIVAAMMAGLSMRSGPGELPEPEDERYARELREGRPGRRRQRE